MTLIGLSALSQQATALQKSCFFHDKGFATVGTNFRCPLHPDDTRVKSYGAGDQDQTTSDDDSQTAGVPGKTGGAKDDHADSSSCYHYVIVSGND